MIFRDFRHSSHSTPVHHLWDVGQLDQAGRGRVPEQVPAVLDEGLGPPSSPATAAQQFAGLLRPMYVSIWITGLLSSRAILPTSFQGSILLWSIRLERRLAETEEPHDVEAGLARLKDWMSAEQPTQAGPQSGIPDGNRHIVAC
jgi:hypothetical protein